VAKSLIINGRGIGSEFEPYIIAEISANHNGSIDTAKRIIEVAKNSGTDAVKLQTYHPDTITMDIASEEFMINDGLWAGKSLYELYESAYMPWEWHKPLFDFARNLDVTIFSSPFDETAVDLLEDLNAPAYKIASFEAVDTNLIKYVAGTGKPMIISTGMANAEEIQDAINAAYEGGCKELAILHCVSGYPAPSEDYNLKTISDMQKRYGLPIGLSDHTIDNSTAIAAVALGACIVEKHVTLNRNGGGPDDSFSLEPKELMSLCKETKTIWDALGIINYERKPSEKDNVKFRRSLYFAKDMEIGEMIQKEHIKSIRPGYGLSPKHYDEVLGKVVNKTVKKGMKVSWDSIDL
jgi:pseudaminic acid synthase